MKNREGKWLIAKIALLVVILLGLGLASLGCIQGLQAVGWSGGAVSGDTLYVGSKEGRLVAVNIVDESRKWSEPLKDTAQAGGFGCGLPQTTGGGCASAAGVAIYGTPAVAGDLVYIGGYNGKIYAYNSSSLEMRWVYPREDNLDPIVGGLVATQGRVYFGSSDGKVYALDAATGDKQWEFETGDKVWSTPVVQGSTLYIGSFDGKLYALNIADGGLMWEFEAGGAIAAEPLVDRGTVYIGSFDRHLYAVNAGDGSLKWKFMGENWFWAKPIVHDDVIYAGCLDGKVYALQISDG
ncbi:PQQ-binding-like beta-propeller repeat protein, partial [Chloroflexota bacterium]